MYPMYDSYLYIIYMCVYVHIYICTYIYIYTYSTNMYQRPDAFNLYVLGDGGGSDVFGAFGQRDEELLWVLVLLCEVSGSCRP